MIEMTSVAAKLAVCLILLASPSPSKGWSTPSRPIDVKFFSAAKLSRNSRVALAASTGGQDEGVDRRQFFQRVAAIGIGGTAILAGGKTVINGPDVFKTPILNNQVMVITGGNTGLGLESAKRLAASGATVVITCRTEEKGKTAIAEIQDAVSTKTNGEVTAKVLYVTLDLCDLASVKAFPEKLKNVLENNNYSPSIDVLMNNAGVMAIPDRQITKDGFERTFQTNHLGHFALTAGLLPMMAKKSTTRIINVSSEAYMFAGEKGVDFDNLNGEKEYAPWGSYGQSKLENILFTRELQKRANEAGRELTTVSVHPGVVQTDLGRYLLGNTDGKTMKELGPDLPSGPLASLTFGLFSYISRSVERGANTQVWLASGEGGSKEQIGGKFFADMKAEATTTAASKDDQQAKELWAISEKLSGVKFTL